MSNIDETHGARRKVKAHGGEWYRVGETIEQLAFEGNVEQWVTVQIVAVDRDDDDLPVRTNREANVWPSTSKFRKLGASDNGNDAMVIDGVSYRIGDIVEYREHIAGTWLTGRITLFDHGDMNRPVHILRTSPNDANTAAERTYWPQPESLRHPVPTSVTIDGHTYTVGDVVPVRAVSSNNIENRRVVSVDPTETDPSGSDYPLRVVDFNGDEEWIRRDRIVHDHPALQETPVTDDVNNLVGVLDIHDLMARVEAVRDNADRLFVLIADGNITQKQLLIDLERDLTKPLNELVEAKRTIAVAVEAAFTAKQEERERSSGPQGSCGNCFDVVRWDDADPHAAKWVHTDPNTTHDIPAVIL